MLIDIFQALEDQKMAHDRQVKQMKAEAEIERRVYENQLSSWMDRHTELNRTIWNLEARLGKPKE